MCSKGCMLQVPCQAWEKKKKVFLSPDLPPKSSEHWRRTHIRADSRKFLSLPGALTQAAPSAKQQRAGLITNGCKNYHWREKKKKKKATLLMVSPNALTAALSVFNGTGCSSVSLVLVALMSLSLCRQRNAPPKPRDGCRKKHPRGQTDTSTAGRNVTPTGAVWRGCHRNPRAHLCFWQRHPVGLLSPNTCPRRSPSPGPSLNCQFC